MSRQPQGPILHSVIVLVVVVVLTLYTHVSKHGVTMYKVITFSRRGNPIHQSQVLCYD